MAITYPEYFLFILVLAAAVITLRSKLKPRDPYGLIHLNLNRLTDGEGTEPKTEWLNMGYWKDTNVFPEACRALALKLTEAARLQRGARVLDVGHGTGESLIMLLSDEAIPRPASLTGITSLELHHHRSQARVARLQSARKDISTNVTLVHEDAVCKAALGHPLHPESVDTFDDILALDCAYHFDTRRAFLAQSFAKLAPGGRVALADICYEQGSVARAVTLTFPIIPRPNVVSKEEYVQQLVDMGYVDVELEDVTVDVIPGFVGFLKKRGIGWWVFAESMKWYFGSGARYIIASGSKP